MLDSTPLSNRRERHSAERRHRLFRAALDLFAQKGFANTTVEDITNSADLGKGTFFNYFPSKEHVLADFAQLQLNKLQAAADAAPTSPLPIRQFLHELVQEVVSDPARNPAIIRALLLANLSSEPVREMMRETHARATQLLARIISIGQQRGEIKQQLDPIEVAQTYRQSLLGTMLVWSLFGDGSLSSRVQTVLDIYWTGLASSPASATHPLSDALSAPKGTLHES